MAALERLMKITAELFAPQSSKAFASNPGCLGAASDAAWSLSGAQVALSRGTLAGIGWVLS